MASGAAVIRRLKKLRVYLFVVAFAYADIMALALVLRPVHANFQNILFDEYQRWRPRERNQRLVRIVEIDDESIRRIGQWPWPRSVMARLTNALGRAHPAAISFVVLFSEPDRAGAEEHRQDGAGVLDADSRTEGVRAESLSDAAFAKAIADQPVVVGGLITTSEGAKSFPTKAGFVVVGDDPVAAIPQSHGALPPIAILAGRASGVGFVNWRTDADRVVRHMPLLGAIDGRAIPSLALETLRVAQGASTYIVKSASANKEFSLGSSFGVSAIKVGDLIVPTDSGGGIRAYFAEADPKLIMPAWKALDEHSDLADLAGAIVVVGVSASMLSDVVATPLNPSTPGVEAEAQLIEQIIDGDELLRPDWAFGAELFAASIMCLGLAVAVPATSALISAFLGAGAVAAMVAASWLAFVKFGVLIDPVSPSIFSGMIFLAGILALYGQKRNQLSQMQSLFGRFVSSTVVSRLAEQPESVQLGGAQRTLTLMFCDLRSFTAISEGMSAVELTRFLNEYLTPMTNIVLREMGTIDKYMGDAIMAFWNAPLDDPAHATHAVSAALAMRAALVELNRQWREKALSAGRAFRKLEFGLGLNTGECCVGNLGSTLRFDYSAIGDEVNVASRLEGSCKIFEVDIIGSEATRAETLDFAWLEIDSVLLKNKSKPVGVYALAGGPALAASPEFIALSALHSRMLAAYRNRDFAGARILATEARAQAPPPMQGLYAFNARRFAEYEAARLAPDWRPLIALEEK
jgi:adenylate cyclase